MIEVVSQAEAEEAEFVVCMKVGADTPFTDNLTGHCCACGEAVIFRPTSPVKPPRICLECAAERMGATIQ